jgi:hypothetical protein
VAVDVIEPLLARAAAGLAGFRAITIFGHDSLTITAAAQTVAMHPSQKPA